MKNKKILIVEDDKPLLNILREKFSSENFEIIEALNGEEGLKQSLAEHPDLILLDIIMPKMDGMTMLQKLRKDEWGKNAKVILLTNLSDPTRMNEAIEEGVFDYLVKSDWRIDDVVEKVKEKLR